MTGISIYKAKNGFGTPPLEHPFDGKNIESCMEVQRWKSHKEMSHGWKITKNIA